MHSSGLQGPQTSHSPPRPAQSSIRLESTRATCFNWGGGAFHVVGVIYVIERYQKVSDCNGLYLNTGKIHLSQDWLHIVFDLCHSRIILKSSPSWSLFWHRFLQKDPLFLVELDPQSLDITQIKIYDPDSLSLMDSAVVCNHKMEVSHQRWF